MCSTFNLQLLTVFCIMVVFMTSAFGHPRNVNHHAKATGHLKVSGSQDQDSSLHIMLDLQPRDSPGSIRPINNYSISPWEYNVKHDDNTIPSTIVEARCLLTGCLNASGEEILDVESRPIYREILVLKRVRGDSSSGSGSGSYHFQAEFRSISVGCTCVRPHVQHQ